MHGSHVRPLPPQHGRSTDAHAWHAPTDPSAQREVPSFTGQVQVPFWFFHTTKLAQQLDLFDGDACTWEILTGEHPPAPQRPHDPLTAWVALAYVGGIEREGPILRAELDREQRLRVAADVLSEEELLVVETIAVPRRYRELPAQTLEDMVRSADDYHDRLWAGCWLTLIGWTLSPECAFAREPSDHPLGRLEYAVIEGYARSQNVKGPEDRLGWRRIGGDYETNLILHRLTICAVHYQLNGPPPYEHMSRTVPLKAGWKQVVHVVPDRDAHHRVACEAVFENGAPI